MQSTAYAPPPGELTGHSKKGCQDDKGSPEARGWLRDFGSPVKREGASGVGATLHPLLGNTNGSPDMSFHIPKRRAIRGYWLFFVTSEIASSCSLEAELERELDLPRSSDRAQDLSDIGDLLAPEPAVRSSDD